MSKDWKEFEELVARIESALVPLGAVVKPNDWIKNNLTGRKRQVDASIRFTLGTSPILITVECRKRKHKQDDTWIEQLVAKKQNLGASKTIAVTTEDISEQAKINARFYGIDIRKVSGISREDILDWLDVGEIRHTLQRPIITDATISLYHELGEISPQLHQSIIELANKDVLRAEIFIRISDGRRLSVDKILDIAFAAGLDFFSDIPKDAGTVHKKAVINFAEGSLGILTENGQQDVSRITLGVDVTTLVEVSPIGNMGFSYSGPEMPTVQGIESHAVMWGESVTTSLVKQDGSDVVHITVTRKGESESKGLKKKKEGRKR
jgi:Restriction endonuclease